MAEQGLEVVLVVALGAEVLDRGLEVGVVVAQGAEVLDPQGVVEAGAEVVEGWDLYQILSEIQLKHLNFQLE